MVDGDRDIIEKIIKGEIDQFSALVEKYGQMVYGVCFRFMENEQEAMDMAQEVFIAVYNNLDRFNFKSRFSTWVYRICVNTCLTQLNRLNRLKVCSDHIQPSDYNCLLPEEVFGLKELHAVLNDEIEKLPYKSRSIVKLRLFHQLSFSEIAKKLHIPSSSARTSFTRSKKRLQQAVKDYFE